MATIPRPLPNNLKAFIAEVEQVVASSEDRRETIARLTPSFGVLAGRSDLVACGFSPAGGGEVRAICHLPCRRRLVVGHGHGGSAWRGDAGA